MARAGRPEDVSTVIKYVKALRFKRIYLFCIQSKIKIKGLSFKDTDFTSAQGGFPKQSCPRPACCLWPSVSPP